MTLRRFAPPQLSPGADVVGPAQTVAGAFGSIARTAADLRQQIETRQLQAEIPRIITWSAKGRERVRKIVEEAADDPETLETRFAVWLDEYSASYDGSDAGRQYLRTELASTLRSELVSRQNAEFVRSQELLADTERRTIEDTLREGLNAADDRDHEGLTRVRERLLLLRQGLQFETPGTIDSALSTIEQRAKAAELAGRAMDDIRRRGADALAAWMDRLSSDESLGPADVRRQALARVQQEGSLAVSRIQRAQNQRTEQFWNEYRAALVGDGRPADVIRRWLPTLDKETRARVLATSMEVAVRAATEIVTDMDRVPELAPIAGALAEGDVGTALAALRGNETLRSSIGERWADDLAERIEIGMMAPQVLASAAARGTTISARIEAERMAARLEEEEQKQAREEEHARTLEEREALRASVRNLQEFQTRLAEITLGIEPFEREQLDAMIGGLSADDQPRARQLLLSFLADRSVQIATRIAKDPALAPVAERLQVGGFDAAIELLRSDTTLRSSVGNEQADELARELESLADVRKVVIGKVAAFIAERNHDEAVKTGKEELLRLADLGLLPEARARELAKRGILTASDVERARKNQQAPETQALLLALSGRKATDLAPRITPASLQNRWEKLASQPQLLGLPEDLDLLGNSPEALDVRASIARNVGVMLQQDVRWLERVARNGTPQEVGQAWEFLEAIGIGDRAADNPGVRLDSQRWKALGAGTGEVLEFFQRSAELAGSFDEAVIADIRRQTFAVTPSERRVSKEAEAIFAPEDPNERNRILWEMANAVSELQGPNFLQQIIGYSATPLPETMQQQILARARSLYPVVQDRTGAIERAAAQVLQEWRWTTDRGWEFRPPELLYPKPADPRTGDPIEGVPEDWWKFGLAFDVAKTFGEALVDEAFYREWSESGHLVDAVDALADIGMEPAVAFHVLANAQSPKHPAFVLGLLEAGAIEIMPETKPMNEADPPGYKVLLRHPDGSTEYLRTRDGLFVWRPQWNDDLDRVYRSAVGIAAEAMSEGVPEHGLFLQTLDPLVRSKLQDWWGLAFQREILREAEGG